MPWAAYTERTMGPKRFLNQIQNLTTPKISREKCMGIVIVTHFCAENLLEVKNPGFVVSGIGFWILK